MQHDRDQYMLSRFTVKQVQQAKLKIDQQRKEESDRDIRDSKRWSATEFLREN